MSRPPSMSRTIPVNVTTAPIPVCRAAKALASVPRSNGSSCTRISMGSAPCHRRKEGHFARTCKRGIEIGQFLVDSHAQRIQTGKGHGITFLAPAQFLNQLADGGRGAVHGVLGVTDPFPDPCEIKHIHCVNPSDTAPICESSRCLKPASCQPQARAATALHGQI